jgi:AMIN domain
LSALTSLKLLKSASVCVLAILLWTVAAISLAVAQEPDSVTATVIESIRKITDKQGDTVEIRCSRALTPTTQFVENPPRLLLDFLNATTKAQQQSFSGDSPIKSISITQIPGKSSSVRIQIELASPAGYDLEASGNTLLVRFRPGTTGTLVSPASGRQPAKTAADSVSDAVMLLTGSNLDKGGSIAAGATTKILRLARGGEVHVCPGTTVSFTPSRSGREMMLAMNTGALETHYNLATSADSILTPDFRILLPGPGEFDFAVSSDAHGNTCVRALPGNTASAVVSELMGDRTYQVKPNDQLVFRSGNLDKVDQQIPPNCGCPSAAPSKMTASAEPPSANSVPISTPSPAIAAAPNTSASTSSAEPSRATVSAVPAETAPLPTSNPNDVHVTVDSSLVFRASDMPNAVAQQTTALPPTSSSRHADMAPVALPPAPEPSSQPLAPLAAAPQHHGFFGKVRGFFAKLFL